MKKLLIEMIIIVSLVTAFGAWTLSEWNKRHPEPVKIVKQAQVKDVKVYVGIWNRKMIRQTFGKE